MAGRTAILAVRIVSEADNRGIDNADRRLSKFQRNSKKLGGAMRELAAPAAVMAGGLALGLKKAGDLAATAEQNVGAVQTVFGKASGTVLKWAGDSAQAVGMSSSSYNSLAASIGGSMASAVKDQDELASKTQELIGASADLSSVFGGDAAEAAGAMGAALRGEFDSMERFGVFLNAAAVEAELARKGQDKLSGAALDAAKKQTIQNLIMKQASKYQGNFAREADTTAGAQQRANAEFENAITKVGEQLLPIFTQFAQILSTVATWISQNIGLVLTIAAVLGTLAVAVLAVNAAMAVYRTAMTIATAVQAAFNMVMAANPVVLVVLAIVALVAAVILAYQKIGWFKDFVDASFAAIKAVVSAVVNWFKAAWTAAVIIVMAVFAGLRSAVAAVVNWFKGAWSNAVNTVMAIFFVFRTVANTVFTAIRTAVTNVVNWFKIRFEAAKLIVKTIFSRIQDIVVNVFDNVRDAVTSVTDFFSTAWESAASTVNGVINGIRDTVDRVVNFARDALGNIGKALGFSAPITVDGYLRPAFDVPTDGSPFMLTAANPPLSSPALFGGSTPRASTVVVHNWTINVDGALDPVAVGRQVTGLVQAELVRTGARLKGEGL